MDRREVLGWLSAGVALSVLFGLLAFHRNYRLPSLVMMLVLIGGGVFFVSRTAFFKDRLKDAVASGKNVEADARYELWSAAASMWRDHFWFGMGPAHFFVEARWVSVRTSGAATNFFPLTAGVTFGK